jgi:serine/threonine protein kinase
MFHTQQQIGPYTLIRLLGQGGFGEVWLAERRSALMTTQVAVKLPLDPNPDLNAIRHEAQTWLRASGHPNVLPVIEADIYDGQVVIVSEYAEAGSLAKWLQQNGGKAPTVEAAVSMTSGILAGLQHLHHLSAPIVHRDLKPDNVLLQGDQPRLTDFGISRVLKTTAMTQNASGTPHFMPPEAFAGRYSPQSDVWAAGVILYQMLSGKLPFPQSDLPSLYGAILTGTPAPLPAHVPQELKASVAKALSKDPAQRFASAADMQAGLKPAPAAVIVPPMVVPPIVTPKPDPVQKKLSEKADRENTLAGQIGVACGIAGAIWRIVGVFTSDIHTSGLFNGFVGGAVTVVAVFFCATLLGSFLSLGLIRAVNFLIKT